MLGSAAARQDFTFFFRPLRINMNASDPASSAALRRRPQLVLIVFAVAVTLTIGDNASFSLLLALRSYAANMTLPSTVVGRSTAQAPCHFICVKTNTAGGLGHRLMNAGASFMLALGTGYPTAALSFEGSSGEHGNYPGADELFYNDAAKLRGFKCCDTCNHSVQHLGRPPRDVQDNMTSLGRWVLDAQKPSCGVIIVYEFFPFTSVFEPVWREMQQLYHRSSPTALALQAQLLYSPDKLNIAIHVRIGDITPTPLAYFALCLRNVLANLEASSLQSAVDVWLFSEARIASVEAELFAAAQAFDLFPTMLRLDAQSAPPLLTFMYLTEADIFLACDSGFSWAATFMSTKPVVIVASNGVRTGNQRVNLGAHQQHILADNGGNLLTSTIALKRVAAAFSRGVQSQYGAN